MSLERYQRLSTNPWTILACVFVGGVMGWLLPTLSKSLSVVGLVYVNLLKMIVMPLMVSAVIFTLQKLFHDGGVRHLMGRIVSVFLLFSVVVALVAAMWSIAIHWGRDGSPESHTALGHIVGINADSTNIDMALNVVEDTPAPPSLFKLLESLIPTNIFAVLANGETLKALVFALLFGCALGQLPHPRSEGVSKTLESVYHACQVLTRWVNFAVPLALICMTADQIAQTGFDPLQAMLGFVISFLVVCFLLLTLAVVVIRHFTGRPIACVVSAMNAPFAVSVATNNSLACMPAMVEGLVEHLKLARSKVELLVPLCIALLRTGAIAYFVCGTFYIAALYDRAFTVPEVGLVVLVSILSGYASTGMSGLLTVSLMGLACSYLGLPFEAAFILFVAVDPICAMGRTAVTVIGGCASVAMISFAAPAPSLAEGHR